MPRAFTTDYEHFADPQTGLLPYIAESVKTVIREMDNDRLQKLIDDIAWTADALNDLLDEVVDTKKRYDQMQNRMAAIETALSNQQAAKQALIDEMQKTFGTDEDELEPDLLIATGDSIEAISDLPAPDKDMRREMQKMMDELLTLENVTGSKTDFDGLVVGDEIDEIAERESMIDPDDDEPLATSIYDGYDGVADVDTDNGYTSPWAAGHDDLLPELGTAIQSAGGDEDEALSVFGGASTDDFSQMSEFNLFNNSELDLTIGFDNDDQDPLGWTDSFNSRDDDDFTDNMFSNDALTAQATEVMDILSEDDPFSFDYAGAEDNDDPIGIDVNLGGNGSTTDEPIEQTRSDTGLELDGFLDERYF